MTTRCKGSAVWLCRWRGRDATVVGLAAYGGRPSRMPAEMREAFEAFDFADPSAVVGRRGASTVAPQALFLMNSPMSVDVARKVTSRPEFLAAKDDAGKATAAVSSAWRLTADQDRSFDPAPHWRGVTCDADL